MTINPVLEESINLHLTTRQFRTLHAVYLLAVMLATLIVWPSRGFMYFFSTQTIPSAFEAIAILQLIALSGIGVFVGMDRLSASNVIRYSEWLEHTRFPVRTLLAGKIVSAVMHTIFMLALGAPFLFISAGPGGIPLRAVFSSMWIMFLVVLFSRLMGMLIGLIGEARDVVRIVGSWIFLATLYLGTISVLQPLNPIIAVIRQQNETSPLVSTVGPVPLALHPAVPSSIYLLSGVLIVVAIFGRIMHRSRRRAEMAVADD